ncbi:MAG TPA: transglutaminaseTgpA domain-containing protein [Acidimicrobiales bacterium]|nr:transglutaminaseTgpA domain-containing protein [Acidimicrobiales bacterium]
MSTTLAPRPSPVRTGPASRPGGPRPPRRATFVPDPAEVALAGLTVAAVAGLIRLFSEGSFFLPVLVTVLAAHALALVTRRLELGPLTATALSGVGLLVVVGWAVEAHTLTFGLPLGRTWDAVNFDLRTAWERFGEVKAPTPVIPGFVLAAAAGGWVVAFASDTFAFRARARFEALAPSFVLFLFGAILGAERYRLPASVLYLAAVLSFLVLSERARAASPSWFAGRSREGAQALVRSGAVTAAAAVALAVLVAPQVPGAHSRGLIGWRDGPTKGSSSRQTVSPLVDIRDRLISRTGIKLFGVRSSAPSYWRLTSLEHFDGTSWSSSGSYSPARGPLPAGITTRATQETVIQEFDVRALSGIWLPAAYRPQRLEGARNVRFDPDSSSLLTDEDSAAGQRYSVQSAVPRLTSEQLVPAAAALPRNLATEYLALPDDFPGNVAALARRVTGADPATCERLGCTAAETAAGELTPYHKARALQDWLRSTFTYTEDVPAGHSTSAIERFLFETRAGYCEQFAGSFSAMARSLGLPSRVAVGFTPGTRAPDGTYQVTDREAHAWPEVYLAGFGWIAFEPTPGRAVPGGDDYTGIGSSAPAGADPATPTATTEAPATVPPAAEAVPTTQPQDESVAATEDGGLRWPVPGPVTAVAVALLVYAVGVPLAGRLRRSRRRARAETPTARVLVAWDEAGDDLALAGLGRLPSETAPEYAGRAGRVVAGVAVPLAELAGHVSAAAYSPAGVDEATAARAEAASAAVQADVRATTPPARRALWVLDPRPLVRAVSGCVTARRGKAAVRS